MRYLFSLLLFMCAYGAMAQPDLPAAARQSVEEGRRLYRSEMASWYGTDLFRARYSNWANVGGYFSYADGDTGRCVFYSRSATPVVIGTLSFDSSYDVKTARVDLTERPLTRYEDDIRLLLQVATAAITSDTFFKYYENTGLNLVPLIDSNEKKVYVLTGPQKEGVVIFGNDYLIRFNPDNTLHSRRQLHKNVMVTPYKQEGKESISAMHSHLPETGDFITATDVCTLMLYEKFTSWDTYQVVSSGYLNIWSCRSNQLTLLTIDAWKRIQRDQEKRSKKKR